jgi:SAM-dependent methyltransferase
MAATPSRAEAPREPLELSAPLAWRAAPGLCWQGPDGTRCDWFHGIWQVLRLLGLNTTPEHHAEFFRAALRELAGPAQGLRVLISGSADYSMLAQLLPALREHRTAPDVTVIDRCETALMLNRWYAEREGLALATELSEMPGHAGDAEYDLICTHSFIGQFDAERRAQLFGAWRRLLRPGGLLLTINRLRPAAGAAWLGYSPEQAEMLADNVRRNAGRVGELVGATVEQLGEAALRYARYMGAWPVRSPAEIRALCEASGFRVEQLSAEAVVLPAGGGLSAPTVPGGAPYARLAARRL